jgi:hypothetical protein
MKVNILITFACQWSLYRINQEMIVSTFEKNRMKSGKHDKPVYCRNEQRVIKSYVEKKLFFPMPSN